MFWNVTLSTVNKVQPKIEVNPLAIHIFTPLFPLQLWSLMFSWSISFFPGTQQKNSLQKYFYLLLSSYKYYCIDSILEMQTLHSQIRLITIPEVFSLSQKAQMQARQMHVKKL